MAKISIDKAIEISTYELHQPRTGPPSDLENATQLGIEALAAIVKWRADYDPDILLHLPSESPPGSTKPTPLDELDEE